MQNIDKIKILGLKKPKFTKGTIETDDGFSIPNVKFFEWSIEDEGIAFTKLGLRFWRNSYPHEPYHEERGSCDHMEDILQNASGVEECIEDLETQSLSDPENDGYELSEKDREAMRESVAQLRKELEMANAWFCENEDAIFYDPFELKVENALEMLNAFPEGSHDGIEELRQSYPWPDWLQEMEDASAGTPVWYGALKNEWALEILKLRLSDETYAEIQRRAILHLAAA